MTMKLWDTNRSSMHEGISEDIAKTRIFSRKLFCLPTLILDSSHRTPKVEHERKSPRDNIQVGKCPGPLFQSLSMV